MTQGTAELWVILSNHLFVQEQTVLASHRPLALHHILLYNPSRLYGVCTHMVPVGTSPLQEAGGTSDITPGSETSPREKVPKAMWLIRGWTWECGESSAIFILFHQCCSLQKSVSDHSPFQYHLGV